MYHPDSAPYGCQKYSDWSNIFGIIKGNLLLLKGLLGSAMCFVSAAQNRSMLSLLRFQSLKFKYIITAFRASEKSDNDYKILIINYNKTLDKINA